ncbi:MAG TPA: hypothetical protein VIK78_19625 [Ruminiclostridium sp.]
MKSLKVRLEEAKKDFDWQDLLDLLDEFRRASDEDKKTIMELEEGNQGMVALLNISRRQVRDLKAEIIRLKG